MTTAPLTASTKILTGFYLSLAFCVISSIIPTMLSQAIASIASIIAIIAYYIIRRRWSDKSQDYAEASYVIKTFWIWSALVVCGMMIAGLVISTMGDMSAIHNWTQAVVEGGVMPSEDSLKQAVDDYTQANLSLMTTMTVIGLLPATIYAGTRIYKGLKRLRQPI